MLPAIMTGQDISIKAVKLLRGSANVMSPVIIDSVLYFSSDKKTDFTVTHLDQDDNHFYKLYKVPIANRLPNGTPVQLFPGITPFHQTAIAPYPTDGALLVTQNLNTQRQGTRINKDSNPMTFVLTGKAGRNIYRAKPLLPSIPQGASVAYPALTADGNTMFFVSDMETGFGGSDIYYCQLTEHGWSAPINAGNIINTPGNETSPFVAPSGKLYFASSGRNDSQGMDIYQTTFINGMFTRPVRLDEPFNSVNDDYGLFMTDNEQWGYLCSSRDGNDQIYYFENQFPEFPEPQPYEELQLCYTFYESSAENYDQQEFGFKWTFSDGTTSRGIETDHCFANPGKYTVSLDVYDNVTGENLFNVSNFEMDLSKKEQIEIITPQTIKAGRETVIEADVSHIAGFTPSEYFWQTENGEKKKNRKINHIFTKPGVYLVVCLVTDRNNPNWKICTSKEIEVTE